MFCPSGYQCLRCDRKDARGGGVLVFYKDGLNINNMALQSSYIGQFYELLCFDLHLDNHFVRFIAVYLPPLQNDNEKLTNANLTVANVTTSLCNILKSLLLINAPTYILGDFNFPHIDWKTPSCSGNSSHSLFLDFCISNSLTQCIDYPTHDKGNTLDILLCNESAISLLITHFSSAPPWFTDHFLISVKLALIKNNHAISNSYFYPDFKRGNYDLISDLLLDANWDFCYSQQLDIQIIYDRFISVLKETIDIHIPLRNNCFKPKSQPKNIRYLLRQKHIIYRKMRDDTSYKSAYKYASKEYDLAVNHWRDKIESNLCANPSSNKLYKFVNSKLKSSNAIPPLCNNSNDLVFDDLDKANLFNSSFQTFFTPDNNSFIPTLSPTNQMLPFQILPCDILKAARKMKGKLSRTPEGIPTYFIKKVITALLQPLTAIFNRSLTSGVVPEQWKKALVIPIFKKGDRRDPNDYRPVSLTSGFSRLEEAVILDPMMAHVQQHNLLSQCQFGFLPRRSSCSQLLSCQYEWLVSHCESESMKVIYTDITKAFDSVNHRLLIQVLHRFGFDEKIILWIKNFLTSRQQQVCIRNATSTPLDVISGVPQGSVLGPFLFILFLDDMSNCISSRNVRLALFADDSKLYSISSVDLQHSMNRISAWLEQHQLVLAPHKCAMLKIKKKAVVDQSVLNIGNHLVEEKLCFKDLGVFVSENLDWGKHIDTIYHKASVKSYQILKTMKTRNIWTYMKLFNTYIRPLVEYNSQIWNPHLKKHIDKLERIQRNYTKKAFERCNVPFTDYDDRLKKIGELTLLNRRKFLDLVFLYKLVNNFYDVRFEQFFSFKKRSYALRSHPLQILAKQKFTSSSEWMNSFFERTPTIWNHLPANIVTSDSLSNFKFLLKQHFLSK
jgi:hypothetical protein